MGTYAITPVLIDPDNKQGNYSISYGSGTLTIYGYPVISALNPNGVVAGSEGFTMVVSGPYFAPDAIVLWTGNPLTVVSRTDTQLVVAVPAELVSFTPDITIAAITVVQFGQYQSSPVPFTIIREDVTDFESAFVAAGSGPVTISSGIQSEGEPAITASISNTGGEPVSVSVAAYQGNPAPTGSTFDSGGGYVDLQIVGADPGDTALVSFYYPGFITGELEASLQLIYWQADGSPEGGTWIQVLGSGLAEPTKELRVINPDGTVMRGRFLVEFSATSQPPITELNGTFFAMVDSTPVFKGIIGPIAPVSVGSEIIVSASYQAIGTADTQWIRFNWGDDQITEGAPVVANGASAAHTYLTPGVYTVAITVTDMLNIAVTTQFRYAVVYDPAGGLVTGGGWIESPAGAYLYDATLAGKATFGFNSKYVRGQSVPTGQTQFQFQAGDFRFHSTAYEWLVVSGARAQYKGFGQVNGAGDYGFLLTATDGQVNGGGGFDKFRIKVWDRASGTVVYDNRRGASDDLAAANPQVIGGGSIVIHNPKK